MRCQIKNKHRALFSFVMVIFCLATKIMQLQMRDLQLYQVLVVACYVNETLEYVTPFFLFDFQFSIKNLINNNFLFYKMNEQKIQDYTFYFFRPLFTVKKIFIAQYLNLKINPPPAFP